MDQNKIKIIIDEIVSRIERSEHSVSEIAMRAKISPSTLSRIANGESASPRLGTLYALLFQVMSKAEIVAFANENDIPVLRQMDKFSPEDTDTKGSVELDKVLDDPVTNHLYHLISYEHSKVTYDDVTKMFGEKGTQVVDKLVKQKIVVLDRDGLLTPNVLDFTQSTLAGVKVTCKNILDTACEELLGTDGQLVGIKTQGTTLEGLSDIKNLGIQFLIDVNEVLKNKPGKQKLALSLVQTLLDQKLIEE